MKKIFLILSAAVVLSSCAKKPAPQSAQGKTAEQITESEQPELTEQSESAPAAYGEKSRPDSAGDGIGEWIEFTLSKPALGSFATNGLRRFYGEERDDKDGWWYDEDEFSVFERAGGVRGTWEANNRVKSMTLTDGEGRKIAALEFSDKFPHLSAIPADWIGQNAVRNPIFLPRGTYRMTIESVYKGKKWDDTVLGEVWFIPLGGRAARILAGDPLLCERLTKAVSVFAGK